MKGLAQRMGAILALLALGAPGVQPLSAQTAGQISSTPQGGFMLKANADLVLTNVVARDAKTGEIVKGLKQSDFKIFENGKEQTIDTFDFESVDMATPLNEATVSGLAAGPTGSGNKAVVVAKPEELRNHRLIVMFFDLTSMQPEDLERAVDAAQTFLRTKMQAADLIALVSLGDTLSVDQDFTADKNALINEVGAYNGTEGQGFAQGTNADSNQVEDTTAYTPDESEYNDLNTDRELFALRAVSKSLEKINEKKSLLYFSGGISRDGIENEASLRSAINSAVRADLAIYSVDVRGLQAIGPLGDASIGSYRGQGGFNGGALMNNMQQNFATQEVMATLSTDTGGTAFFDSNDFAPAFAKVQADTSAFYAIGFHSSNLARDGKYRKLTVKIDRPGIKLEYRPGYYAPADFKHSGKEDREQELEDQLASDLPATDMAVYMDAMFFRLDANRFYMPVSLVVPGSQIPFVKGERQGQSDARHHRRRHRRVQAPRGPRARHRQAQPRPVPAGAAEEHSVHHQLQPAAGQVPDQIRGARESDRSHGFIHRRCHAARSQESAAQDELHPARLAARAEQEAGTARPQRPGVRAQHQPRLPPGPAHVPALRGLRARAREGRRKRAQRNQARHQPAQQPRTDSGLNQGLRDADCAGQSHQRRTAATPSSFELDVPLDKLKPGQYVCQLNVASTNLAQTAGNNRIRQSGMFVTYTCWRL